MIKALVFSNHRGSGFAFYGESPDFPAELKDSIEKIQNNISSTFDAFGEKSTYAPAFRYSPLNDQYSLLSVIFYRTNGTAQEHRAFAEVVNFVMDLKTAEELLFYSFTTVSQAAQHIAEDILMISAGNSQNAANLHQDYMNEFRKECNRIPFESDAPETQPLDFPGWFWLGLASLNAAKDQVFLPSNQPCAEISHMMELLPLKIRTQVSFNTNILNAKSSFGCAINFSSRKSLANIVNSDFKGGPNTCKTYMLDDSIQLPRDLENRVKKFDKLSDHLVKFSDKFRNILGNTDCTLTQLLDAAADCTDQDISPFLLNAIGRDTLQKAVQTGDISSLAIKKLYEQYPNTRKKLNLLEWISKPKEVKQEPIHSPKSRATSEYPPSFYANRSAIPDPPQQNKKDSFRKYFTMSNIAAAVILIIVVLLLVHCMKSGITVIDEKAVKVISFQASALNELVTRISLMSLSALFTAVLTVFIMKKKH